MNSIEREALLGGLRYLRAGWQPLALPETGEPLPPEPAKVKEYNRALRELLV